MGRISVLEISVFMLGAFLPLFILVKPGLAVVKCPVNMVKIGKLCVDKYEASVWSRRPDSNGNPQGTQFGVNGDDYPCSDNGNDCFKSLPGKIFAVSAPGVTPSAFITWFQAQQACANVGKRLLRNGEWQMAAAGTPDPGTDDDATDCNITFDSGSDPVPTGSRSNCVSNWGVFDMVGNLWEWVEDWVPASTTCVNALYAEDFNCLAGASTTFGPGALVRGGGFGSGAVAGVFALNANNVPSSSFSFTVGFRCAR